MTTEGAKNGFRIGDWRARPALNALERDGHSVQLEPKVMVLLEVLASRPGEVFSRGELEQKVWTGTVIGYDALAKAINKLREALGDDHKQPRYIQTISKRGYRLVAEVGQIDQAGRSHAPGAVPLRATPRPTLRRGLLAGALVLVLAVISATLFWPVGDTRRSSPTGGAAPGDTKPAIVVLPFRNLGPARDDDYLADGLTSDLITNLSKLSGLWVVATDAVMPYKDSSITSEALQEQFDARYVLRGDVSKANDILRINARLTDIARGRVLWADRYERRFDDFFALQDELTTRIIDSLSLALTSEERRRIARRYTTNLQAYEVFLRAQSQLHARAEPENAAARELYKTAIVLDPGFARAYAGLALTYSADYIRQWTSDVDDPPGEALRLARKAIALDPDLPEGYWAVANVHANQKNFKLAIELLDRTLELNPNYADGYAMLGGVYFFQGYPERTIEAMDKALRLNPTGGYLYQLQVGRARYALGNYELALEPLLRAYQTNPAYLDTIMTLAATYVRLERLDDAAWMLSIARGYPGGADPLAWLATRPFAESVKAPMAADLAIARAHANR